MSSESIPVAQGSDDALSYSATLGTLSAVQTGDTSAILGKFVNNYFYEVFVFFQGASFASTDTITACDMDFELAANSVGGGNSLITSLSFHNSASPVAVSNATNGQTAYDSNTSTVSYDVSALGVGTHTTPDLSTPLGQISGRSGGEDVLLIWKYVSSTGQDYIQQYLYDYGGGSKKPVLNISWTTGGGGGEVFVQKIIASGIIPFKKAA